MVGWKLRPDLIASKPKAALPPGTDFNERLHPFISARKWVFELNHVALQTLAELYKVIAPVPAPVPVPAPALT